MSKLVAPIIGTLAMFSAATCWSATPVAVWDGDFSATQTGYTLNLNGNDLSSDKSTITISQNVGVTVTKDEDTFSSGFTVLVRYSDLNTALADKQVLATSTLTDANDRTGVTIDKSGLSCGIWDGSSWNSSGTFNSMTSDQSSGVLAFMHYSTTSYSGFGTKLLSLGKHSVASTTIMNAGTLGSDNDKDKYKSIAIGGRNAAADGFSGATGMKIRGVAVFSGILAEQDMFDYRWPTDVSLAVDEDTSVSALNSQLSQATRAFLSVADGVKLTLDEEFAIPVVISSEGSVSLYAASQPDASYFSNVYFSNVQGALLRSWLPTPGVAGFNFRSANGSDVSGALVAGENWIHDNNSANGTSTAMFADGLSTLTWVSANTWACSGSTIISGYLDDGSLNGNGAEVRLSNVPYETYDVVVYCSSDSNPGAFLAKAVNGTTYTWDSTTGAVVAGNAVWGKAALSIPVYGVNALRIKNLSGPLTIYGGARNGANRGGIAAIQIMPPGTPDNIRIYTLTLDGTATTWSTGNWTLDGHTVDAPTSGNVKIVAGASTALTVDSEVNLADLVVTGAVDAVVNVATNGIGGSLFTIKTTVAGGVFQQGSPAVLGATPTVVVEDGATFDMNGQAVNEGNLFKLAGAGAGNWPWALTSSGGEFPLGTLREISLNGNTTIGGANRIRFGRSGYSSHIAYNTFTLTKTGACELVLCNGRSATGSVGTLDVAAGEVTFTEFTCIDGYEDVYAHTAVIVREGATIRNNTDRFIWMDSLNWLGGEVISAKSPFAVTNAFEGSGTTAKLRFASGAQATLTGDLVITNSLELGSYGQNTGDLSLVKAAEVNPVTVTVSGTFTSAGAVSVGAGVTLNLGANRPTATFDVNDEATLSVRLLDEIDVPVLHVTGRPTNLILYDEAGDVVSNPIVTYNSENGTIAVSTVNLWTKVENESFDDGDNWSTGAPPSSGANAAVLVTEAAGITVQNDYTLSKLGISGAGDMTFSGTGSIAAQTLDFSETTGRVEYNLPTGSADVKSGSNTLILGGGSGTPTVAASQTLTLGPWGTVDDSGLTNMYSTILRPAAGATLAFSPGEGRVQKTAGFGGTDTSTTIAVTNGTLVVNLGGEGTSKFFGRNSVRIDNGGVVSLESQDALGWSNADGLTINKGGTLVVKVRDTLKRTVAFNGGTIELYGANGTNSRALDLYGNTINVNDDSSINQMELRSVIYLRNNTTTNNVADGKTLSINANIYAEGGNSGNKLLFQSASGALSQNGVVVLNGYSGDAKQYFNNETTVGTSGRAVICELNCEHQNGIYTVNAASRLRGSGSITGNGGVTLAASNAKLCGSLTVNNLTAASGGTYGDQWNAVAAKVATSYFAAGTQTIENGSFMIGADCAVTNSEGTADTTDATFSIAADGSLKLEKSVTVAGLTVADGGTITLVAASRHSVPTLNVASDTSFAGTVNFVMDFGSASTPGGRTYTLMTGALPNLANVSVSDGRGEKRWKVFIDGDALKASSSGDFVIRLR